MGAGKGLPSGCQSPPSERTVSSQGWKRLGRECLVPPCLGAPGLHPHAPRHLGDRDGGAGEGAAPGGRRPPLRVHPSRERAGTEGQRRGMVRGPAGLGAAAARPHLPVHLVRVTLGACRGPRKGGRRRSPGGGGRGRVEPPAAPTGWSPPRATGHGEAVGCPGKSHLYLSSTCCMPGPVQSP